MERVQEVGAEQGKKTEVIIEAIAGPETAARLGIPVGSVFDARHCVSDAEGNQIASDIVTPEEAAALTRTREEG
jgi:hypothetical protein